MCVCVCNKYIYFILFFFEIKGNDDKSGITSTSAVAVADAVEPKMLNCNPPNILRRARKDGGSLFSVSDRFNPHIFVINISVLNKSNQCGAVRWCS